MTAAPAAKKRRLNDAAGRQRSITSFFKAAPAAPATPERKRAVRVPTTPETPVGHPTTEQVAVCADEAAAGAEPEPLCSGAAEPEAKAEPSAVAELLSELRDAEWREALKDEFEKPYFVELAKFVRKARASKTVYPPPEDVFTAFNATPVSRVRVVIIGQDPYHNVGQAHGLSFSVRPGVKPPPSLVNMYKELEQDVPGFTRPGHGYLMPWAEQGVLLLNATLTVEAHNANSHKGSGWQTFTDAAISHLSRNCKDVVFLLWGGFAQKKGKVVDRDAHVVLECAHPSPLSLRFWRGCRIFSKCNAALKEVGRDEIDWALPADPTGAVRREGSIRSAAAAVALPDEDQPPLRRMRSTRSAAAATALPDPVPAP